MLLDFILEQLKKNDVRQSRLLDDFSALSLQEESDNKKLNELLSHSDVGMELFSPRSADKNAQAEIEKIQLDIQELKKRENRLSEEISDLKNDHEKWQNFLSEFTKKSRPVHDDYEHFPHQSDSSDSEKDNDDTRIILRLSETKGVLNQIDHAISLISSDPLQAKDEMVAITYFLKALISAYASS